MLISKSWQICETVGEMHFTRYSRNYTQTAMCWNYYHRPCAQRYPASKAYSKVRPWPLDKMTRQDRYLVNKISDSFVKLTSCNNSHCCKLIIVSYYLNKQRHLRFRNNTNVTYAKFLRNIFRKHLVLMKLLYT